MIQNEKLPTGVERSYLEKVDLTNQTRGGGLNWGVIHTGWGLTGLAAHNATFSETRALTDGAAAVDISTRGIEKRRQLLLSGTETLGVSSSIKRVTTFDADGQATKSFGGVDFGAKFSDDAVRGYELNRDMIGKINSAFGTAIPEFKEKGRKQSREISLSMGLNEEALGQLHVAPETTVHAAARATLVPTRDLISLQRHLKQAPTAEARAEHLQEFICKHGFAGMGAIHRLRPKSEQETLQITTSSNAYSNPSSMTSAFAFEFKEPMTAQSDAKDTIRRFKEGWKIKEEIKGGLQDLADDPLLTDTEKAQIKERLLEARATVDDKLSFSHLQPSERKALYDQMGDSFWMSSARVEIRTLLFEAGLTDQAALA